MSQEFKFYEFFAGGGMVRAGLGAAWNCLFANDFDGKKGLTYQNNWGTKGELYVGDIRDVSTGFLADTADLSWASFPCQDLSLAGVGAGLAGSRSGTFYPFWNLMTLLMSRGRGPKIIALENVCGALTSHGGADFRTICKAFSDANYKFGAVVINASMFLPQSRSRVFFIGLRNDVSVPNYLRSPSPIEPFHTRGLKNAFAGLSPAQKTSWVWWNLPRPMMRTTTFASILENFPSDVSWNSDQQTNALFAMMSETNQAKVEAAKCSGRIVVGGVYKRTRIEGSTRVVRAEVRFDDLAGCLRTPNGGSSRQTILLVRGQSLRSRLLTSRETARLMGLSDSYKLPKNYNEAYHLTGDGVAVPVVKFISANLFEPILSRDSRSANSESMAAIDRVANFGH